MLKTLVKGHLSRRAGRMLPGGWVTLVALHPRSRALIGRGARGLHRRYLRRR